MEINPVTFELVYEMVSGHNPELKQRFAETGPGMSRADLDALCRQFLPHHFGEAILGTLYRTIRDELDHFQEDLNESRSTLSDFAGTLSTTSRALTGLKSPDIAPIRSQIDMVRSAASAHQAKAARSSRRSRRE